jgi:glycosyltransferase involved in cell wall biosynthesis
MKDKGNRIAFLTNKKDAKLDGITTGVYELTRKVDEKAHRYLKDYEESIIHGQCAARLAIKLKQSGFIPDIIFGHSWGPISFMKDVFPGVPLIGYFEWFYNSRNSDADFGCKGPLSLDTQASIRIKNSHLLVDLYTCDGGIVPTEWQKSQFPHEFKDKLTTIHDGVDTTFFKPAETVNGLSIPGIGLHIPPGKEIVTYATRGMEPYRGFLQFMEAASLLLKQRPECHVVISGRDTVSYGPKPSNGKTYKELMLETYDFDMTRLHFTGFLPYHHYLHVLQASSAHVYLTYPFVLSWSMLEAMSAGCALIASNTPPVAEVVQDNHNGFLVDFFSPEQLFEKISFVLNNASAMTPIRQAARQTVMEHYDQPMCLERQLTYLRSHLG